MLGKLWRGEYGLYLTFWLFGVLGFIVLNAIAIVYGLASESETFTEVPSIGLFLAYVQLFVVALAYQVILTVAVVRSIKSYAGNVLWSVLAVLYVVGSWFVLLIDLVFVLASMDTPAH